MKRILGVAIVGLFLTGQAATQEIDYSQLKLAHTLKGHESSISALAVSPDGKTLATASYDKSLRVWDLPTGMLKRSHRGHEATVRSLCFSPDGAILASAGGDNAIKLWDVSSGQEIAILPGESETRSLTFSPDGETLASASHDKTLTLWSVSDGRLKTTIDTGHRTWVREILFSPDGTLLASNGYYDVRIWSAAGEQLGTIKGRVSAMKFSDDGKTLTSAISNRVTHWTVAGEQNSISIEGEAYASYKRFKAILSPDGKSLASVDQDRAGVDLGRALVPSGEKRCRLIIMNLESGEEHTIVATRGPQNWFGPSFYSPNGEAIVLSYRNDESISVVNATTGEQHVRIASPDGKKYQPGISPPLTFTPDGKTLITTHGPLITLWVVP